MLIEPRADEETLIGIALRQRPEMMSRTATTAAAQAQLREEQARPFLPTIWIGASGGAFGGGSNLAPPTFGSFGGRSDFDALAYWTLENFGLGNLAMQRRRRAEVGATFAEAARTASLVREEVAAARADALAERERVKLAVAELATSERGFRLDLERARQARGLPIEVLNNLDLLIKSREDLVRTVVSFNQAQLRLFVALGTPPPLEIPATGLPRPADFVASEPNSDGPRIDTASRDARPTLPAPH
jgi:outer membrane protein TolC